MQGWDKAGLGYTSSLHCDHISHVSDMYCMTLHNTERPLKGPAVYRALSEEVLRTLPAELVAEAS